MDSIRITRRSLLGGAASCVDQVGLRDAAGAVKPVA